MGGRGGRFPFDNREKKKENKEGGGRKEGKRGQRIFLVYIDKKVGETRRRKGKCDVVSSMHLTSRKKKKKEKRKGGLEFGKGEKKEKGNRGRSVHRPL